MNFIHHLKKAYPKSSCEKMIEIFDNNASFAVRGTAGKEYLDDLEMTLEITDADCHFGLGKAIYKAVDQYKTLYPLIDTNISDWNVSRYCQLMRYEPNNYYSRVHCENDGSSEFLTRVFAWMIYLNDIQEGGGTHFVHQNFTAKPMSGDLYIWPAYWTHFHHGVNAPYERKYIITGWVNYVL